MEIGIFLMFNLWCLVPPGDGVQQLPLCLSSPHFEIVYPQNYRTNHQLQMLFK